MAKFTPKTGEVWLRDFDSGVVLQLQPTLINNNYFVVFSSGLSGSSSPNVPVIFNQPEQVYEIRSYPFIHVKREAFTPALERWHSYGQQDHIAGVPGTENIVDGEIFYDQVEIKPQAWPYDIEYVISVYSRFEYEAQTLLRHVMRRFQPRGYITVQDSVSEDRFYTYFSDPAVADIGEIVDVAQRLRGYSVSVKVEGEIDLVDPVIRDTVQQVVVSTDTN